MGDTLRDVVGVGAIPHSRFVNMIKLPIRATAPYAHSLTKGTKFCSTILLFALCGAGNMAAAQTQPMAQSKATPTSAEPVETENDRPEVKPGDGSRTWLGAQARREQASRNRPTLSGPVLSRVNKRYVESFPNVGEPAVSFRDRQPLVGGNAN